LRQVDGAAAATSKGIEYETSFGDTLEMEQASDRREHKAYAPQGTAKKAVQALSGRAEKMGCNDNERTTQ